jgi:beta-catenin-like protein 1
MNLRQRALELLTSITTREEIYSSKKLQDWTHLPPYIITDAKNGTDQKELSTSTASVTSVHLDAIEILLQNVGVYRKRQPKNNDEMEYIENCCMVMTSILTYAIPSNQSNIVTAFIERQGIELVIRCLKERVYTGATTLEWLDFHGSHTSHRMACEYMVHVGILKYLFPLFLGKHLPKFCHLDDTDNMISVGTKKKKNRQMKRKSEYYKKIEGTTIRILYSLVRHLRDDSPNDVKARFVTKFIDDDQKVQRLIDLYMKYDQQVRMAEYKFYQSDIEDTIRNEHRNGNNTTDDHTVESMIEMAVLDAKLQAGGDIMYRLAAIIAFCCCASKKCHTMILNELQDNRQSGISVIKDTLREFISMLDAESDQRILLQQYHDQI